MAGRNRFFTYELQTATVQQREGLFNGTLCSVCGASPTRLWCPLMGGLRKCTCPMSQWKLGRERPR